MLNDLVIPAGGGTVSIDHAVVSRFGVFVIRSVYAPGLVAGTEVARVNFSMDVRNAIHGLEVWPFD